MLLASTSDGVHRAPSLPFSVTEAVLDVPTRELRVGCDGKQVFAATERGLFVSADDGDSWSDLDLPTPNVHAVLVDDEGIYAGVRPAGVYRSGDGGGSWIRLRGFDGAPGVDSWPTNPHRDEAWVRTLATPATERDLLVAGVEVGGLVYSRDGGETWRGCPDVPDDVHHITCRSPTEWVVSCGTGGPAGVGGVFRTTDGGATWTRFDTGDRPYVRASCATNRLHTAANRTAPLWEPPDAALFVETEDGELQAVPYPNEPSSFVIAWARTTDGLLAGTNDGRILQGDGDDWRQVGTVPITEGDWRFSGVRSLVAY